MVAKAKCVALVVDGVFLSGAAKISLSIKYPCAWSQNSDAQPSEKVSVAKVLTKQRLCFNACSKIAPFGSLVSNSDDMGRRIMDLFLSGAAMML